MKLETRPFLTAEQIRHRVAELAQQISADSAGREVLMLVVLKGGFVFASDLMRSMTVPVVVDFVRARSYEETRSSGAVTFSYVPEETIAGRHVVVVEDIIDTGRTSRAIMEYLNAKQPASVSLCALLDKPSRREVTIEAQYVGFTIEDHFVVGYGLDYEQHGRELPNIRVLTDAKLPLIP